MSKIFSYQKKNKKQKKNLIKLGFHYLWKNLQILLLLFSFFAVLRYLIKLRTPNMIKEYFFCIWNWRKFTFFFAALSRTQSTQQLTSFVVFPLEALVKRNVKIVLSQIKIQLSVKSERIIFYWQIHSHNILYWEFIVSVVSFTSHISWFFD